ncbi:hypothetical protein JNUCC42_13390 [Brevibacterium sp. JNUCC-42]|nr:hypothetical protein JNUCC42_13390 [Brevibacterium sp. JNUCC-42]
MLDIRQHRLHKFSLVTKRDGEYRLLGLCRKKQTLVDMSAYLRKLNPDGYPDMWIMNNRTKETIVNL